MRAAGAAWVFFVLAWLPFEDTAIWPSLALGATGVAWLAWRPWPKQAPALNQVGLGALAGIAAPLAALCLMALKSGLHGHGFADFLPSQVIAVLQTIPLSAVAGCAAGVLAARFATNSD